MTTHEPEEAVVALSRADLQRLADEHLQGPLQALKAHGVTVVCLVAPTEDPKDGKAVIATTAPSMAIAIDALDQLLRQLHGGGAFTLPYNPDSGP